MDIRKYVIDSFRRRFHAEPEFISRAPGRVNLLGEHVDYNNGFVLPAAIDRATWIAFMRSTSLDSTIQALDLDDEISFSPSTVPDKKTSSNSHIPNWGLYPAGVAWSLMAEGFETPAMDAAFASDVPRGAGLSSSASVEMAFAVAWERLGGWSVPPMRLALVAQRAENKYVGVNCGIMDQFASACGVRDHILYLDCRSLDWKALQIPAEASIVIANTSVRRSLSGSAYNDRRNACEEAVSILQGVLPGIKSLRDVSLEAFNQNAHLLPHVVEKRARHVVEEILRTKIAVEMLNIGDLSRFGQLMDQCHASLRDLYEVSCFELDIMVEIGRSLPGCFGSRLTGAGFGGCTVNLVSRSAADQFANRLADAYEQKTGLHPEVYICRAENGAMAESL
jgi:galactokinase